MKKTRRKAKVNPNGDDILALMIQAERRDILIGDCLSDTDEPHNDPFHGCHTIVKFVQTSMDYDIEIRGEIDRTGQEHYLRGENFDPMMDPDYWDERDHYGENQ